MSESVDKSKLLLTCYAMCPECRGMWDVLDSDGHPQEKGSACSRTQIPVFYPGHKLEAGNEQRFNVRHEAGCAHRGSQE